jgi:hypothetical protein
MKDAGRSICLRAFAILCYLLATAQAQRVTNLATPLPAELRNTKALEPDMTFHVGGRSRLDGGVGRRGLGHNVRPSCGAHSVVRADLRTGRIQATIPVAPASSEGGIAIAAGNVWLATSTRARPFPR